MNDVEFGHHGKECSFDALVKKEQARPRPGYRLLAKIVNGGGNPELRPMEAQYDKTDIPGCEDCGHYTRKP